MNKLTLLVLLCTSCLANAKDLGVQGNLWPITEVDIRQLLLESASRTDWDAVNKLAVDSAKNYLGNLPKRTLTEPPETSVTYFDPSLVLTSDIQAPVKQADGKIEWQLLAAKGSKVNPLDTYRPATAFFLFDGSKQEQLDLLKDVLAAGNDRIVPVEAGAGDLKELGDTFKRPIFHANDAFINRFQVRYLPTLVFPGEGTNSRSIGVAAFAQPFSAPAVIASWGAVAPVNPKQSTGSK